MVKTRKVLAVVLSVLMIVSCFAVGANALSYTATNNSGEVKIIASADKTTVNAGDVVTVSLAIDRGSKDEIGAFGNVITYNSNQLTPCDVDGNATTTNTAFRTWQNSCANWTAPTATCNFNYSISQLDKLTAEEKAYYTKNVLCLGTVYTANGAVNAKGAGWVPEAGEVYMTFQMKVADTVNPGDEIWVGLHEASFLKGTSYFFTPCAGSRIANTDYDLSNSMVKLTVASEETSILQWSKAQIRFKGIAQNGTKADYLDYFDVRTVAKISEADFIAKFGSDEAAKSAITDLGFVYMINGENFDYATAVEVANGASAADYTKKSVSYIQHAGAGEDYIFTCLITDNPDAAKNDTLTCIAFVKTADETIVFDAPSTVNYSDLYGLMPA